ncbi:MAG: DUF3781 domain-containing protein [Colwellia sp.]
MDDTLKNEIASEFKNTELGFVRIKKNLAITHFTDEQAESFLKNVIESTPLESIETKGKNHYFKCFEYKAILTVNSHSFTVITAKPITA